MNLRMGINVSEGEKGRVLPDIYQQTQMRLLVVNVSLTDIHMMLNEIYLNHYPLSQFINPLARELVRELFICVMNTLLCNFEEGIEIILHDNASLTSISFKH